MKILNNKIKSEIRAYRNSLLVDQTDTYADPFGQFADLNNDPKLLSKITRDTINYYKYWLSK